MKRQGTPLESGRERRRQDPVSCSLCRTKKLKCSREQPCSNCRSRGLACDFGPQRPVSLGPSLSPTGVVERSAERTTNDYVLADVLSRLQRLERAVLDSSALDINDDFTLQLQKGLARPLPAAGQDRGHNHPDPTSDQTFDTVEGTTTRDDAASLVFADRISYGIRPINELIENAKQLSGSAQDGSNFGVASLSRHIWLPQEHEALALFQEYVNSTGAVYHIFHSPTTRRLIQDVYTRLYQHQQLNHAHMGLLLAIVATGAYFWTAETSSEPDLFINAKQATDCSVIWIKWALDVTENNRRTIYGSVEDIQATVLLTHVVTNVEGFSPRARFLYSTVLNMARDISLHMIDSPRYQRRNKAPCSHICNEVKRRLWWYIASSDWLMCSVPGPQEGFYSVNPNMMCVRKPLNINDDDLSDTSEPQGKPLSQPTEMSYFLIRNMAGELSRMIIDAQPPLSSSSNVIAPSDFVMLEAKTEDLLSSIPVFFRNDFMDDPEVKSMHAAMPQLTMQRAIINLGIYVAKIRLHRPYLFRKSLSPPYTRSREACIMAARQLIGIRRSMEHIQSSLAFSRTRITFVVQHVFMAVLVLSLDLCFNDFPSEAAKEQRHKEVREACAMLEDTKKGSAVASRYLDPLLEILRKHRITLQESGEKPAAPTATTNGAETRQNAEATTQNGHASYNGIVIPENGVAEDNTIGAGVQGGQDFLGGLGDSDTLWQDMLDFPTTFETTPDWDQLFADLDSTYTF